MKLLRFSAKSNYHCLIYLQLKLEAIHTLLNKLDNVLWYKMFTQPKILLQKTNHIAGHCRKAQP